MIRTTSKAILLHENHILLNQCNVHGRVCYDLPGGGQAQYESMEEALEREILEECGYYIRVTRLAAIGEQICNSSEIRVQHPDYAHRLFHLFFAELTDSHVLPHTEEDVWQQRCVWVDPKDLGGMEIIPAVFAPHLEKILRSDRAIYCGTLYLP